MTMSINPQQNSSSPRRIVVSVAPTTRKRVLCVGAGAMSGRCNNSPVNGLFCSGCADEVRFSGKKPEALRLADLPKAAQTVRVVEEVVKTTAAQPAKPAPVATKPVAAPVVAQKPGPAPTPHRCYCGKDRDPKHARCPECHEFGMAVVKKLLDVLDFLYEDVCARREANRPQKPAPVVNAAAVAKREKAERERAERTRREANERAHLAERIADRAVTAAVLAHFKEHVTASRHDSSVAGAEDARVPFSAKRSSGSAQIIAVYSTASGVNRSLTILSPEVAVALAKEKADRAAAARKLAEEEARFQAVIRRTQYLATPKPEEDTSGKKGEKKNKGEKNKGGNKKNGKK